MALENCKAILVEKNISSIKTNFKNAKCKTHFPGSASFKHTTRSLACKHTHTHTHTHTQNMLHLLLELMLAAVAYQAIMKARSEKSACVHTLSPYLLIHSYTR